MNENINIFGFDPSQLSVFDEQAKASSTFTSNIYKAMPKDSKSEDGIYRATIKIVYNPFNPRVSILERQVYSMQDADGWFSAVSKLTNNDTDCPIFRAWKSCRYSKNEALQRQAYSKEQGGTGVFDKRFERYVLIQVIEDRNQPELQGKYMFWKVPKAVWDKVSAKINPDKESNKASVPVLDPLIGRAIELIVNPGPNDPKNPERKTREIKYTNSELSDEVCVCTKPDGSSMLTADEQDVLDTYTMQMEKLWRQKDPEKRAEMQKAIYDDENTGKMKDIYNKVIELMKGFCPNLVEEMGYKEWSADLTTRINNWIGVAVKGGDPVTQMVGANGELVGIGEASIMNGIDPSPVTSQAAPQPTPTSAPSFGGGMMDIGSGSESEMPF